MKTHMNNTTSVNMKNDICAHKHFQKHQHTLHSGAVKPIVSTKRKQQVKIVKNKKVELTTNPNQHVNHLFSNLHNKTNTNIKPTIDNKVPDSYKLKSTVLKDKIKKNKFEKHQLTEHEREWKALQNRIQNCKSIQQRKKDKTDPIVNPVYFIKNGENAGDLTIDPYARKILEKNRPKSAVLVGSRKTNVLHMTNKSNIGNFEQESRSIFMGAPVPDLSKTSKPTKARPSTANNKKHQAPKHIEDLPQPTYKGILSHLLEKKIYKDTDIKVLYVRLCHAYGEDSIDEVWEQVMDHLEG